MKKPNKIPRLSFLNCAYFDPNRYLELRLSVFDSLESQYIKKVGRLYFNNYLSLLIDNKHIYIKFNSIEVVKVSLPKTIHQADLIIAFLCLLSVKINFDYCISEYDQIYKVIDDETIKEYKYQNWLFDAYLLENKVIKSLKVKEKSKKNVDVYKHRLSRIKGLLQLAEKNKWYRAYSTLSSIQFDYQKELSLLTES